MNAPTLETSFSVVASGGTRGDFVAVGPDGFLYVTQSSLVEQLQPAIFASTIPPATPPTTPLH